MATAAARAWTWHVLGRGVWTWYVWMLRVWGRGVWTWYCGYEVYEVYGDMAAGWRQSRLKGAMGIVWRARFKEAMGIVWKARGLRRGGWRQGGWTAGARHGLVAVRTCMSIRNSSPGPAPKLDSSTSESDTFLTYLGATGREGGTWRDEFMHTRRPA
eukprot:188470-Chlamydomonas_euryale.AAC.1